MKLFERFQKGPFPLGKLDAKILGLFISMLFEKKISKGDILLREGEICDKIFYVEKGLLRLYNTINEKEVSTWFVSEGEFITTVNSFYHEKPSLETFEALEDSTLFVISKKNFYQMMQLSNRFALFANSTLMENLCQYQDQCIMLRNLNAAERYQYLQTQYSKLIHRISQKHLATFISIEETYVSKIRKKIAEEKS